MGIVREHPLEAPRDPDGRVLPRQGKRVMNTPAHLLLGVAVCARRDLPRTGTMAALGSLIPDLSLYFLAGISLFVLQIPPETVFAELYFSPAWQAVFAVDNSFLVWGLMLLVGAAWRSAAAVAFSAAGLLHLAADFLLHNDDARRHFWPVSTWIFESPLSYWDSAHHAAVVAPIAFAVALIAGIVLWRRWDRWSVRFGVVIACALEAWVMRQWLVFF